MYSSSAEKLLKNIFSQNPIMGKVRREHSGSSGPISLLKQGHPRAHGTGLHPDDF